MSCLVKGAQHMHAVSLSHVSVICCYFSSICWTTFTNLFSCIHHMYSSCKHTPSVHTVNCSINRFHVFPLFSQKTINIVKHTVTACSSFLITCTIFIYLYNKSYLTIQFLFYEWQSLRFVQLQYFGDNCLILLPTFLLNKNIYIIYTPYIIFFKFLT